MIFAAIREAIAAGMQKTGRKEDDLVVYNSICGQVANRAPWLIEFSKSVDILIFVGGRNSSNSKMLFEVCRQHNRNAIFITQPEELKNIQIRNYPKIGITGATSTPSWLIEAVADYIRDIKLLPV